MLFEDLPHNHFAAWPQCAITKAVVILQNGEVANDKIKPEKVRHGHEAATLLASKAIYHCAQLPGICCSALHVAAIRRSVGERFEMTLLISSHPSRAELASGRNTQGHAASKAIAVKRMMGSILAVRKTDKTQSTSVSCQLSIYNKLQQQLLCLM